MFQPLTKQSDNEEITVHFNGEPLRVTSNISVAAALLSHDIQSLRQTLKSQSPRGPFCMMGACFECLVQIDGVTRQACMTIVEEGLEITSMPQNQPVYEDLNQSQHEEGTDIDDL